MKKILLAFITFLSFSLSAFAGVNINTATQAELETLDGVGPVKAMAIIDYRKKNGGFKSVDELEKVNGIGSVTLQNVRKDVSVSGATTAVAPATKPAKEAKTEKPAKAATSDKAPAAMAKSEKAPAATVAVTKPADTAKADKAAAKEAAKAEKEAAKAAKKAAKDKEKADKAAAKEATKAKAK